MVHKEEEEQETCAERCKGYVLDKGNVTLVMTLVVVTVGSICMFVVERKVGEKNWAYYTGSYLLSIGLFAFSGGMTNWIAIQMLFYKIPLVYGSGVIASRYKSIRRSMKDMILETFFQPDFLNKYIPQKLREAAADADIENKINTFLNSEAGQEIIDSKIDEIARTPEGQLIESIDINVGTFKPLIKPVIISFLSDLGPTIMYHMIDPKNGTLNLLRLRAELDRYMCERMEEVTPQMMVDILYCVVLHYLGWLVVWGCIFGSFMGAACQALEMTPKYEHW